MKRLALPLLFCCLVAAAALWILTGSPQDPPFDPAPPARTTGRTPAGPLPGERDPRRSADPERSIPLRRPAADADADAAAATVVTGRCLDSATRAPLPACAVTAAAVDQARPRWTEEPATGPEQNVFTDGAGRFRVSLAVPPRHGVLLTVGAPGRAGMRGYLTARDGAPDAGSRDAGSPDARALDTGDILIPPGAQIRARVVDAAGTPQPGVALRFFLAATAGRGLIAPRNWIRARSDGAGFLTTGAALAAGIWRITADANVRLVTPAGQLDVPGDREVFETEFVVRMPDPKALISGVVRDERGQPVKHVAVHADDGSNWAVGYGMSDAEGRFEVACRIEPREPVRLAVPRASSFEPLRTEATYAWGSEDVVLTLVRAGDLTVQVRAADTGDPIEDYRVVWFTGGAGGAGGTGGAGETGGAGGAGGAAGAAGAGGQLGARGPMGHHPGGTTVLRSVPSGRILVVAMPDGKEFAPNEPTPFEKRGGDDVLRIELGRCVDLPVRIVDGAGKPLAGTRIELVRGPSGAVTPHALAVDHGQYPLFARATGGYVLRLDDAVTGADGRAVLRWTPGPAPAGAAAALALRVLGPGHVPLVHEPVGIGARNAELRIVVRSGATLAGAVAPRAVLEAIAPQPANRERSSQPLLQLRFLGADGPQGALRNQTAELDAAGRFEVRGLHPGAWEVTFRAWRIGAGRRSRIAQKTFPPITLHDGEVRRVDLDITDMQPATLRGRVTVNGAPRARGTVRVTRLEQGRDGTFQQVGDTILTTDELGSFVAGDLQPGQYRVSVDVQFDTGQRPARLVAPDVVHVPPAGSVDRVFAIEWARLRARLIDAEGKPVRGRFVRVSDARTGFQTGATSGKDGWFEIAGLAVGTYSVGVYPAVRRAKGRLQAPKRDQVQTLGEVTVHAGPAAAGPTFTLRETTTGERK